MRQIHFEMRHKAIHTQIQLPTHTFSHQLLMFYEEDSISEVGGMECEKHFLKTVAYMVVMASGWPL